MGLTVLGNVYAYGTDESCTALGDSLLVGEKVSDLPVDGGRRKRPHSHRHIHHRSRGEAWLKISSITVSSNACGGSGGFRNMSMLCSSK